MKSNYTKLASLLALFLLMVNMGCSEPESESEPEIPPTSLTTEKNQYSSFEFIQFEISSVPNGTIPAKIGEYAIALDVLDTKATTILPNLINGNYQMTFQNGTKNYVVNVKIVNRQNTEEADVYFNQSIAPLESKINQINSGISELIDLGESELGSILSSDLQIYLDLLETYKAQYSNLSDSEKQEFAQFMSTHSQFLLESASVSSFVRNPFSPDNLKGQATNNHEKEIEVSMISFTGQVIFTVSHIPAILTLYKMLALPNPWIQGGALVGAGIIVSSFMINTMETATAAAILYNKSIKPIELLVGSAKIKFESAKETFVDIKAKYRSIIRTDSGAEGSVIKSIANSYDSFKDSFNSLRLKLPESFRPSLVIADLKDTYNNSSKYVYNEYIKIVNVDNPNVQVEKINLENGGYKIKATTSQTTTQEFKFDVEYTNSKFAGNLKERLSGEIEIIDSIPIYTAAAVGNWTVKNLEGQDVYTLVLYSDGTGKYTGYFGGETFAGGGYGMSWSIIKREGRYYFRESGFWHPGYNQFRVIDSTLPLGALKYPIDFFFFYTDIGQGPYQSILYTKL